MSSQRDKLREQLSAYLDGELSGARAAEVAQAVEADAELAAELASLRKVRDLVGSLPRESAPDDLAERVLDRVERGRLLERNVEETGRAGRPWVGWLATAAVAVIAVGAGVFLAVKLSSPTFPESFNKGGNGRVAVGDSDGRGVGELDLAIKDDKPSSAPAGWSDRTYLAKGKPDSGNGSTLGRRAGGRMRVGETIEGVDLAGLTDGYVEPAPVRHFYMNTDNLVVAKADVERVLASNGIVYEDRSGLAGAGSGGLRANVYNRRKSAEDRVEYEVAVTPEQMQEVFRQLNSIRREQRVPQVPVAAEADAAADGNAGTMADALDEIARTLAEMTGGEGERRPGDDRARASDLRKESATADEVAMSTSPRKLIEQAKERQDLAEAPTSSAGSAATRGGGTGSGMAEDPSKMVYARDDGSAAAPCPASCPAPESEVHRAGKVAPDVYAATAPCDAPAARAVAADEPPFVTRPAPSETPDGHGGYEVFPLLPQVGSGESGLAREDEHKSQAGAPAQPAPGPTASATPATTCPAPTRPAGDGFLDFALRGVAKELSKRNETAAPASRPAGGVAPKVAQTQVQVEGAVLSDRIASQVGPTATGPAPAPATQPAELLHRLVMPAARQRGREDSTVVQLRIILNEARSK
ncbi:MAG TPA: hypothetical protein VM389_04595 [Phycisphaerae bacterium]|nr:hypothetical protein [Phycisphaerae bacterium]